MFSGQPLPRRGITVSPFALLLAASTALAQGTVTGRVTAKDSGEPLPESRVAIVGTALVAATGPDGRFTVRNVPAGSWVVRRFESLETLGGTGAHAAP